MAARTPTATIAFTPPIVIKRFTLRSLSPHSPDDGLICATLAPIQI
jgi:hypothetical protein